MRFSDRINSVEESGTVKFTSTIQKLRREGKKIIDFSVGEPDFPTPQEVIGATKKALDEQKTKYGAVSGELELKEAIAEDLKQKNLEYGSENIIITNGAKQALYNALQTICSRGDEIIIPKPYWTSFPEQVKLAEAKPVFADTKSHQLDTEEIRNNLNEKTKAVVINSPCNPTGAVFEREYIKEAVEIAEENNLFIISDETYEDLVFDGKKHHSPAVLANNKGKVITVKSFSKTYSMTGYRVGYAAADEEVTSALNKLQSHGTGNVCTFAQSGAVKALQMDKEILEKKREKMRERRNLAYSLAEKLFECVKPQGAFYLFPNVKDKLPKGVKTTEELSTYLLEKANVAVVPGEVFGSPGSIRISYACGEEDIKKGFERIKKAL